MGLVQGATRGTVLLEGHTAPNKNYKTLPLKIDFNGVMEVQGEA